MNPNVGPPISSSVQTQERTKKNLFEAKSRLRSTENAMNLLALADLKMTDFIADHKVIAYIWNTKSTFRQKIIHFYMYKHLY